MSVKLCSKCETTKPLIGGYYKAGNSWQKLCKVCHNSTRKSYTNTYRYVKKPIGFKKLSQDLQDKIIYDVHVRINFKDICIKYPELKHQSLTRWNRAGQIPEFIPI